MAFVDNFIFLICSWRQAYFPWELQTRFSVLQHRTKPPTWTHKNHWIILFLFFNINIFIFHWSLICMHDLRLLYLRVRQVTLKCKYFFPCLVFVLALPGWITWLGIAGEALRVQMYLIFVPSTSEGHVSLWGGTKYEVFFRASRNVIFRVFARPVNKLSLNSLLTILDIAPRRQPKRETWNAWSWLVFFVWWPCSSFFVVTLLAMHLTL